MRRIAAAAGVAWFLAGAAQAQPAPCAASAEWSLRRKVVQAAVCEWARFGYPVVEIRPASPAQAAALPAALGLSAPLATAAAPARPAYAAVTPAVEVQTRFGLTESDRGASNAIESYWATVRPAYVSGMRQARQAAGGQAFYPGWWDPWSAAFTSWVMRSAGVAWFSGSASHVQYLKAAKAAQPRRLVRIDRYKPLPGDLVCAPRADAEGHPTAIGIGDFVAALDSGVDHFETHCDVVVRVNRGNVVLIGGNVRNAVTATVAPLRNGRMVRTNARPWAVALSLGEPYDPCARIESVALAGWDGLETERRRVLARTGCAAR